MEVLIAPMTEAHIPEAAAIEREARSDPWSPEAFREELAVPHSRSLVARLSGEEAVAGYVVFWVVAGELQILNLAVRADARRRGLGRMLLGCALASGRAEGAGVALLEVAEGNAPARALYGAAGFRECARRPGYYRGGETALCMELSLGGEAPPAPAAE